MASIEVGMDWCLDVFTCYIEKEVRQGIHHQRSPQGSSQDTITITNVVVVLTTLLVDFVVSEVVVVVSVNIVIIKKTDMVVVPSRCLAQRNKFVATKSEWRFLIFAWTARISSDCAVYYTVSSGCGGSTFGDGSSCCVNRGGCCIGNMNQQSWLRHISRERLTRKRRRNWV